MWEWFSFVDLGNFRAMIQSMELLHFEISKPVTENNKITTLRSPRC